VLAVVALIVFPQLCKGGTVRPKTIVYFERIIFEVLLLGILDSYLSWDAIVWAARSNPNTPVGFALAILIFSFVLNGTLTLLVSRRRSKIAMWVLSALGRPRPFVHIGRPWGG
jgi:hypothetical protein